MGIKGDKLTEDSVFSAELMVERLEPIGGITSKKMFGGHGLFHEGKMFGLIDSKGKAFMKAGDSNMADFEAHGATQHSRMPYYSIPMPVFEEPDTLREWAQKSIALSK